MVGGGVGGAWGRGGRSRRDGGPDGADYRLMSVQGIRCDEFLCSRPKRAGGTGQFFAGRVVAIVYKRRPHEYRLSSMFNMKNQGD